MNILDTILANQVKILAILTPTASAVSEAVSPVVAVAEVGNVTAVVKPIIADIAVASPTVTPVVAVAQVAEQSTVNVAASLIELDKEGLPHDTRINTKDPSKTVKNLWKAKKGGGKLDAAATEVVKTELRATVAANPAAYKPFGEVATVAPVVVKPVVAAVVTPVVVKPVVAPVVVKQIAATPIVEPDLTAVAKGEAIASTNLLIETWKVDYDDVLEVVGDFGNAKSFDELAPEHYPACAQALKVWLEWLTACQDEIDHIVKVGAEQGSDGVTTLCGQYGVATAAGVHHLELGQLYAKLQEYRGQWDAAIAAAQ